MSTASKFNIGDVVIINYKQIQCTITNKLCISISNISNTLSKIWIYTTSDDPDVHYVDSALSIFDENTRNKSLEHLNTILSDPNITESKKIIISTKIAKLS